MSSSIKERIEAEYDAYCLDKTRDLNEMYNLMYDYIRSVVSFVIKKGDYVDKDSAAEITQEVMIAISMDAIHKFKKEEAKFTTYCGLIARRRALDYVRKRDHRELVNYDDVQNEDWFNKEDKSYSTLGMYGNIYKNPEILLIRQERLLEQVDILKKYLQLLMNYKAKPYRVVSCCYSMVLFHKYNPDTKVLASPKWAFDELGQNSVEDGADRYHKEINKWFPNFHLFWGDAFQDKMDEKENDIYISDMIFEEHFKQRDFENWCLRTREDLRQRMFEQVQNVL